MNLKLKIIIIIKLRKILHRTRTRYAYHFYRGGIKYSKSIFVRSVVLSWKYFFVQIPIRMDVLSFLYKEIKPEKFAVRRNATKRGTSRKLHVTNGSPRLL